MTAVPKVRAELVAGSPAHIADITHRLRLRVTEDDLPRLVAMELLRTATGSQREAAKHAADAMRLRDAAMGVVEGRLDLPAPVPALDALADAARRRLMAR